MSTLDDGDWWASLNHGGLLIAPSKVPEFFGGALPPLARADSERLRREVIGMLADDTRLGAFLDHVFERLLGLESSRWQKANRVAASYTYAAVTGEAVRPRRMWCGDHGEVLPVFATDGAWGKNAPRIGVGRGRRAVSRVIEWLRNAEQQIAVLTNGRQIRVVHAGSDYDAFCEWDIELWFDEGAPGPQVTALRRLLGRSAVTAQRAGETSPLLQAILASRRGQGELSAVLGERVRQGVEELITASSARLEPIVGSASGQASPNDVYIAAIRMVMRLVVVLFAEARELLPRDNALYHGSYGLQGLREQLDRAAGGRSGRLRHRHGAWPRLLGLFRLVYQGSAHEELPIPAYGGGLFEPGQQSGDGISRALYALEAPTNAIADDVVHHIIELLTRSRVKLRQGKGSMWVEAPVDFSDLSSEYIGILYEGLLDYELRRAPTDDPMVFLNIGDQPVLPLSRLDGMTVKERADLLKKLEKESRTSATTETGQAGGDDDAAEADSTSLEGEGEQAQAAGDDEQELDDSDELSVGSDDGLSADTIRYYREMVDIWARNAVRDAGWTKRGADMNDPEVIAKANRLIRRLVLPAHWFLVRWGGTRKGAGTFYTRPQLAGPTTRRTLQPLAYAAIHERTDRKTGLVEVREWAPRKPEEILALKVCDPAMGSGSFLVSALRYLTDALFESLHHHGRLESTTESTIARLADGVAADHPSAETLPVPRDHEDFEGRLHARLKRHIVERCIYGVDIDPVAVELARLALWIETMDRSLPFEFLDHKLKVGNSLVGCWFDCFQDYPIMAWEREGGDKDHRDFVSHFRAVVATKGKKRGQATKRGDRWTQAIKDRKSRVKAELASLIDERSEPGLGFGDDESTAVALHDDARSALEEMHAIPVHETTERARLYTHRLSNNPAYRQLTQVFDTWCSLWFWPGDQLDVAPGPRQLTEPDADAATIVAALGTTMRFFHWELEFPDVFSGVATGFDAMVGNPPWDIQKPSSKEFFSNYDPIYRTYGKQEALAVQRHLFANAPGAEDEWIAYKARFKSLSNWVKHAGQPFGDHITANGGTGVSRRQTSDNAALHASWRQQRESRRGYADPEHPFRHQGSADLNTYKLFLELAHVLVRRDGHLGMLVPSGIYTDKGTISLRQLFLDRCRWHWLFGFENREGIFNIHRSFKFAPIIIQKGGETTAIRAAFMRRKLEEWDTPHPRVLAYPRERVRQFSPRSTAILELSSERDVEILQKLYSNGVVLGEQGADGWGIAYRREFDMTNDSKLFPPRPDWEKKGYAPDEYGHWLKGGWRRYSGDRSLLKRTQGLVLSRNGDRAIHVDDIEDVALPLYEGRMIGQFDFAEKGWVSGKGRAAEWRDVSFESKVIEPQFLMGRAHYCDDRAGGRPTPRGLKAAFMDISSATNTRSTIAALVSDAPAGNQVPVLAPSDGSLTTALVASLNSFVFDYAMRARLGGLHLNYFVVEEVPLQLPHAPVNVSLQHAALALSGTSERYARSWLGLRSERCWRMEWALASAERLRRRAIVDALTAYAFGLEEADFARIVSDCDHPVAKVSDRAFASRLDPKGFWRVDKEKPPELRHSVIALVAFLDLLRVGLDGFATLNEGEGWMLPETLRLADYGLGHDAAAREHQPVAAALGPRFYDWQQTQGVEESWEECQRHADLIERIVPLRSQAPKSVARQSAEPVARDLFGDPVDADLFDEPIRSSPRRGRS